MSAVDILTAQALARPDKPALVLGDQVLIYAELNRLANRSAAAAAALGLRSGDRAAQMGYNSLEGFAWSAGLRKLGAVGVPINFRLRGGEIAYVIADSGAKLVLAGPEFVEAVDEARSAAPEGVVYVARGVPPPTGWVSYEESIAAAGEEEPAELDDAGDLGKTMIYTSGTTGNPKGVYRPGGAPELALQGIMAFELTPEDVHLMAGPGYHSAVGYFAALHLALGSTVVVMPHFEAEEALRLIERHRVTTAYMPPILFARLVALPEAVRRRYNTSSLRALIAGAAPFPFELKKKVIAAFGEVLWEFYGATETGINTVLRPEDQLRKPGSCGALLPGHEALLLDEEGMPVPEGQPGVFWVRNSGLAEYYNRPEATARALHDGYFSVGDVAYRDAEGYYFICDRMIDMIISGGVNIYPAEVEAALYRHPAIRDAAVIGVPDDTWGESVKAVVALQPGASLSEAELLEWCRTAMADYRRPRSIDFVDELPRDAAGKLLKRKLREPYWAEAGRRI